MNDEAPTMIEYHVLKLSDDPDGEAQCVLKTTDREAANRKRAEVVSEHGYCAVKMRKITVQ